MQDDEFEWDDAKAFSNFTKHRTLFEIARAGFDDAFALTEPDLSGSTLEDQFRLIAAVEGRMFTISFCYRGPRIRIISARKATRYERRRYYDANSGKPDH